MLVKRKNNMYSFCGIEQKNLNVNIKVTKINYPLFLDFVEKEYYNKLLVKEKNNTKGTWKILNSIIKNVNSTQVTQIPLLLMLG